ncbi:MAG: hypothetical protein ACLQVN_03075 [Bryobacteraceae bacterium]
MLGVNRHPSLRLGEPFRGGILSSLLASGSLFLALLIVIFLYFGVFALEIH